MKYKVTIDRLSEEEVAKLIEVMHEFKPNTKFKVEDKDGKWLTHKDALVSGGGYLTQARQLWGKASTVFKKFERR